MSTSGGRLHREAQAFLSTIGATGISIEPANGSGHPRLAFTYDGTHHRVPISNSPSDHNAPKQVVRQLRRLLHVRGDAPRPTAPRPDASPHPEMGQVRAHHTGARGSVYASTGEVRFSLPQGAVDALGPHEDLCVTSPRRLTVELRPRPSGSTGPAPRLRRASGGRWLLGVSRQDFARRLGLPSSLAVTELRCSSVPGCVTLEFPEMQIREGTVKKTLNPPPTTPRPPPPKAQVAALVPSPGLSVGDRLTVNGMPRVITEVYQLPVTDEQYIRDTLERVRLIERTTPYRLMRTKSEQDWVFAAPRID